MSTTPVSLEPPFGKLDPSGMAALVDAIPEQIEQALERTDAAPWKLPKHETSRANFSCTCLMMAIAIKAVSFTSGYHSRSFCCSSFVNASRTPPATAQGVWIRLPPRNSMIC